KAEVAAHLERYAGRSRWSKNRFVIEIPVIGVATPYWFNNSGEVSKNFPVMSANEWRCDFFPQRHWLLGWNALTASWLYKTLVFQDGQVVKQEKGAMPYKTYGVGGESPYPQFPKNFHKVNENIYRSGQPDEDEFFSLYTFNGIRSVLNLRGVSDKDEINAVNRKWKNGITLYEIPLDTGNISEDALYKILSVIRDAPKPLLIHCWHGSNRTGCAVAAYRIAFENWSVEDAISELTKPEYGHLQNFYSNIPELLRKADWRKIKTAVLNKSE
ncbi:MAG: dual specificity protein phosphatase family protein, partial [Lentisphaeria bacterium]|nr:dual specificity protein phosphatase family protein [Lentisphaeria bacterium]